MQQTTQHAMTTYVSDMLAVVQHVSVPINTQVQDEAVKAIPEAASVLPRIKQTIDRQIARLEAHLEQLGGHPASGVKEAVSTLFGNAAAAIDKSRKTRVTKMVRDDQTALTLLTTSYMLLNATAIGFGEEQTAHIAQQSLEELTPLVMELNRCIPAVVINELQQEGFKVDTAAVRRTQEESLRAWT